MYKFIGIYKNKKDKQYFGFCELIFIKENNKNEEFFIQVCDDKFIIDFKQVGLDKEHIYTTENYSSILNYTKVGDNWFRYFFSFKEEVFASSNDFNIKMNDLLTLSIDNKLSLKISSYLKKHYKTYKLIEQLNSSSKNVFYSKNNYLNTHTVNYIGQNELDLIISKETNDDDMLFNRNDFYFKDYKISLDTFFGKLNENENKQVNLKISTPLCNQINDRVFELSLQYLTEKTELMKFLLDDNNIELDNKIIAEFTFPSTIEYNAKTGKYDTKNLLIDKTISIEEKFAEINRSIRVNNNYQTNEADEDESAKYIAKGKQILKTYKLKSNG